MRMIGFIVIGFKCGPRTKLPREVFCWISRAAKRGGFKRRRFPDLDFFVLFCPSLSFLGLSRFFLGFSRIARGWSGDFPDLSFSSFSAYYNKSTYEEQSPKGSATQSGPFPKKVGNTRVWKPPGLASLKNCSHKKSTKIRAPAQIWERGHRVLQGAPWGGDNYTHFSKCSRPLIQSIKSTLSHLKSFNPVRGTLSSTAWRGRLPGKWGHTSTAVSQTMRLLAGMSPKVFPPPKKSWNFKLATGQIRFRRAVLWVRFQTPNSVSFLALTEFREENSVSSSQPIICVPKRTHRVFRRTHRVCPKIQWGSVSSLLRFAVALESVFRYRFLEKKGFWAPLFRA